MLKLPSGFTLSAVTNIYDPVFEKSYSDSEVSLFEYVYHYAIYCKIDGCLEN